jgi:transcription termination factor Rho
MSDNEQTPTAVVTAPPQQQRQAGGPDEGPAQGGPAGQPGQSGRRRRRRRGRRGRGPQGNGLMGPNGEVVAVPAANGAPVAVPGQAAAAQPQVEVTEEVEGVLQFEGKGNGWLRDPKRSYLPQPFDVEVPRWLVERMHLQPGLLVKGVASVRNMKRVLSRIDTL